MADYLSEDLRIRVIEAVEAGSSRRGAAARFGVSVSSAIRWVDVWRRTGRTAPYPRGGDRRSGRIEGAAAFLRQSTPGVRASRIGTGTVWRFLENAASIPAANRRLPRCSPPVCGAARSVVQARQRRTLVGPTSGRHDCILGQKEMPCRVDLPCLCRAGRFPPYRVIRSSWTTCLLTRSPASNRQSRRRARHVAPAALFGLQSHRTAFAKLARSERPPLEPSMTYGMPSRDHRTLHTNRMDR